MVAHAMTTHLDRIVSHHRSRVVDDPRLTDLLVEKARAEPPARGFADALRTPGVSVVAEVKRRSPSKGELAPNLDPVAMGMAYAEGGAACLSVLTDERFFGGSLDDLVRAREASRLPVLRKDFTLSANDVCDARLAGADAVLLIVSVLDDTELKELSAVAGALGMACLVETHDEAELERALSVGAELIGVNQRDLSDFSIDPARAARLAKLIPDGVVGVAESGITGGDDVRSMGEAGYDAVLVGEHLVRSTDPVAALRELVLAGAEAPNCS